MLIPPSTRSDSSLPSIGRCDRCPTRSWSASQPVLRLPAAFAGRLAGSRGFVGFPVAAPGMPVSSVMGLSPRHVGVDQQESSQPPPGAPVAEPPSGLRLTLNRSWPAISASVPIARRAITELARAAGADAEQLDAVRLACSEAVTNVVLHAYRERPGLLHVDAAVARGELWVLVADDGCGLEVRSQRPGMGQGLRLIAAVADDLTIVARGGGGTELRMRFDLTRASDAQHHGRGSVASATAPAMSRFSTTR